MTYIINFPFHPDRFNPDSVEHRRLLIEGFKAARVANPVRLHTDGKAPLLLSADMKDAEVYAVEAIQ